MFDPTVDPANLPATQPFDLQKLAPGPRPEVHTGMLLPFYETGTEGVLWALQKDGTESYEGLMILEPGDHLRIEAAAGHIVFDGIIEPDHQAGWRPRYPGADHGQPVALGFWVHWTQKGWNPDDWARLFIAENNRGTLVRTGEIGQ